MAEPDPIAALAAQLEDLRGLSDGYVRAIEDLKAYQHGIVRDAEIEAARWGPGGREHFADPRPGDFPDVKKEAERERELEAGLHGRDHPERRV
jgi:hypothetical protein